MEHPRSHIADFILAALSFINPPPPQEHWGLDVLTSLIFIALLVFSIATVCSALPRQIRTVGVAFSFVGALGIGHILAGAITLSGDIGFGIVALLRLVDGLMAFRSFDERLSSSAEELITRNALVVTGVVAALYYSASSSAVFSGPNLATASFWLLAGFFSFKGLGVFVYFGGESLIRTEKQFLGIYYALSIIIVGVTFVQEPEIASPMGILFYVAYPVGAIVSAHSLYRRYQA